MSEGLEAVMHTTVAPSDDELISELTEEVDKAVAAHETQSEAATAEQVAKVLETQKALEALDKEPEEPEDKVVGERVEPITAEAVAGKEAEAEAPPARTVLRDQLQAFLQQGDTPAAEPANPQLEELKNINTRMMELFQQQVTGKTPEQLAAAANNPQNIAQKALATAQKAQQEADRLRAELAERERESQYDRIVTGISNYASAQGDKYPLVNDGNQGLVATAMLESLQDPDQETLSEDEALAYVEGKLRGYVETQAKRLGWTPPGTSSNEPSSSNESPETVTKERGNVPPAKSFADMGFDERDEALINLL